MAPKKRKTPAATASNSARGCVPQPSSSGPAGGDAKRKSKRKESYSRFLYLTLKQIHPGLGISSRAMAILNSMMTDIFEKLASEARKLTHHAKKKTLSSREIQTAVRLVYPGDLAVHAVSEGTKALNAYFGSGGGGGS